ncbi:hypothetical protein RN001_010055 [Aquatica leii]|uniref:Secreted protein n=1 Tax=Aquatica leii TaxID=1421715 RepID=A0AAN7PUD6_9COLE|nr:hypothetical protein RN001_010055 [Aquatica leii]
MKLINVVETVLTLIIISSVVNACWRERGSLIGLPQGKNIRQGPVTPLNKHEHLSLKNNNSRKYWCGRKKIGSSLTLIIGIKGYELQCIPSRPE